MKSIYMVKKDPSKKNDPGNWRVMGRDEFLEFISTPEGRMRASSFGRLSSCGQNDPVIIAECGSAEAKKWKDEQNRHRYLREIEKEVAPFRLLSLNQPLDDDLTQEETLCDENVDAEAEAIGEIRKGELKEALDRLDPMEKSLIEEMIADAYKRVCYITIEQPSFSDQGDRLQAISHRLNMASYAEEWQTSYSESKQEKGNEIPLWKKATLSINEAATYTGIGENKLRELSSDGNCGFVLWVGQKRLIKRKQFEEYLEKVYSI